MAGDRDKAVRGQFSPENRPVARANDDHGVSLRGLGEGGVGGVAGPAGGVGEEQEPGSPRRRMVRGNRGALKAVEGESGGRLTDQPGERRGRHPGRVAGLEPGGHGHQGGQEDPRCQGRAEDPGRYAAVAGGPFVPGFAHPGILFRAVRIQQTKAECQSLVFSHDTPHPPPATTLFRLCPTGSRGPALPTLSPHPSPNSSS